MKQASGPTRKICTGEGHPSMFIMRIGVCILRKMALRVTVAGIRCPNELCITAQSAINNRGRNPMPQRGDVPQPRVGRGTRPTLGSMCERFPTPTGLCPAGEVSMEGRNPLGVEDMRGAGPRGSTEDGATPGWETQSRWDWGTSTINNRNSSLVNQSDAPTGRCPSAQSTINHRNSGYTLIMHI